MGKLFDKLMYANECFVEWKQEVAKTNPRSHGTTRKMSAQTIEIKIMHALTF